MSTLNHIKAEALAKSNSIINSGSFSTVVKGRTMHETLAWRVAEECVPDDPRIIDICIGEGNLHTEPVSAYRLSFWRDEITLKDIERYLVITAVEEYLLSIEDDEPE